MLQKTYNCSGTPQAIAAWNAISNDNANTLEVGSSSETSRKCEMLAACELQPGEANNNNATCGEECYDTCWKTDVGDCSDWDDEQTFCVRIITRLFN
jgi:hypothetical protein